MRTFLLLMLTSGYTDPMGTQRNPISKFKGLNNIADPFRLTPDWSVQADNVDISSTLGLTRCRGFVRRTTNVSLTGAYATIDQTRLYVVDSGELRQMTPDFTAYTVLKTGLQSAPLSFEEVNGVVFYANGVDFGMIEPAGWRPWGIESPQNTSVLTWTDGSLPYGQYYSICSYVDDRGLESGNSDLVMATGTGQLNFANIPQKAGYTTNIYVTRCNGTVLYLLAERVGTSITYNDELSLGREFPFWGTDQPRGDFVCFFQGQMFLAEVFPQYDYTVVWSSLPLHYHHFSYDDRGMALPGLVRMLERADGQLIIGTDRQIFGWDGEKLTEIAPYGVVEGHHGSSVGDKLFFWSLRGLCSAMPFKNLTEDKLSVAPGSSAGAMVLEKDGMRRYVVALRQGGQAYNRR